MATNTFVALDKKTLASNASTIEFTGISSAYTDLILVLDAVNSINTESTLQFNGNSGSYYSSVLANGDGSSASSNRYANQSSIFTQVLGCGTDRYTMTFHIQNYSNTTTYKPVMVRFNAAGKGVSQASGLWRGSTGGSTEAINAITLGNLSGGTYNTGTTVSLYGVAAIGSNPAAKATGGTITYGADGYTYHTFTSTGTFTPSVALTCDYLVVAGGGSGGGYLGGGGGAGGYRTTVGLSGANSTAESPLSLSATSYTVQVGAGGPSGSGTNYPGNTGTSSIFASITSTGGGFGGGDNFSSGAGGSGGSGGGSRNGGSAGAGTSLQGYNGAGSSGVTTGSGGGAGGAGIAATTPNGRPGGPGLYSSLANSYLAGGGAGGTWVDGVGAPGGVGGGGASNGGNNSGTAGAINTGGGGGGGGYQNAGGAVGGAGGSGIVIVRYASV